MYHLSVFFTILTSCYIFQLTLGNEQTLYKEIKSHGITGPNDFVHLQDVSLSSSRWGARDQELRRQKRSLFTLEYEQRLVDKHNTLRRREAASDMEFMTRHSELTKMAEEWALGCVWEHGQPYRSNPPFEHIGQNLYAYNGTFDAERGLQLWFDEYVYWDYDTLACSKEPCGHYTQMVWATSRMVGCAYAYCPSMKKVDLINANYLVCNYGPAGNFRGQKPFKKGRPCTECETGSFWCDNGLCRRDCTRQNTKCECKAACENCAQTISGNCSCSCKPGWHGPRCTEICRDNHPYCGAKPGWPKSFCVLHAQVRRDCPAMCDQCQVQTGTPGTCVTPATTTSTTPETTTTTTTTPSPGRTSTGNVVEIIPDESGSYRNSICPSAVLTFALVSTLFTKYSL